VEKSTHTVRYRRLLDELIEARKAAGLTQVDVAKRLRRHQSFVSKYERGERRVDVVEFMHICEVMGADPFDLLRSIRR
jgi:transcriptional regulator with XRE-family HTH domain